MVGTGAVVARGDELVLEYQDGGELAPYPYVVLMVGLQGDDAPALPFRTDSGSSAVTVVAKP